MLKECSWERLVRVRCISCSASTISAPPNSPSGDCTYRRRHCVAATQRWTYQRSKLANVSGIRQPLPQGDTGEDHERKN